MRNRIALVALALASLFVVPFMAHADNNREVTQWGHYKVALGRPEWRVTVTATAGTPRDNTGAGAGSAYAFEGGEHICLQSTSSFCFEVVAEGSMAATCAKAVTVPADSERCFFLKPGETKISIDALSGTPVVRMFETRI